MRLSEALDQSPTATLRRVASAHGLAHDDTLTRDELIAALVDRFADHAYLVERVDHLTDEERAILAAAHASAGELRGLLLDAEHPGIAEDLADRGWLFRVFASAGPLRGEVFVVPDELLALLPSAEEPRLRADAEPPAEPRWTDPAFSLFALTSALTRHGGHLEQELRHWSQEPGGWHWKERWDYLQHAALGSGLLVHRSDGATTPGPGLARLLDDRPSLAERLSRNYARDRGWSELQRADMPNMPERDAQDVVDVLGLRAAVADAIESLPHGRWLRFDAFSNWLKDTRPTVVREQLTPRGLALVQNLGWSDVEEPLLRYFLLGPLYWLGVIGTSRDGQLICRREPGRRQAAAEACHWEATAELVAPATVQLGSLLQAERYLVLRERDRVSRYHLVQAHVAAALGAGGSIAECRRLLTRLTQEPLPATLDERLQTWEQRFGSLAIRPAVVLQARTADDLDAAIGTEAVRPFVRGRLGPTVAEVAAADALELAAALRASDHLPRVDAALRLKAYGGLIDEQVLEFLLVSLLALRIARPEQLAELEGSSALIERLEQQFPAERQAELRLAAHRLASNLNASRPPPRRVGLKRVTRKR